jgi:hypothetical protein
MPCGSYHGRYALKDVADDKDAEKLLTLAA